MDPYKDGLYLKDLKEQENSSFEISQRYFFLYFKPGTWTLFIRRLEGLGKMHEASWSCAVSFDSHQSTAAFVSLWKCMNIGILFPNVELWQNIQIIRWDAINFSSVAWLWSDSMPALKSQYVRNWLKCFCKNDVSSPLPKRHRQFKKGQHAATHACPHPRSDPRRAGHLENLENHGLWLLEFS